MVLVRGLILASKTAKAATKATSESAAEAASEAASEAAESTWAAGSFGRTSEFASKATGKATDCNGTGGAMGFAEARESRHAIFFGFEASRH